MIRWLLRLLALLCAGSLAACLLLRQGGAEQEAPVQLLPKKEVYAVGILQGDRVPEQDRLREGFLAALAGEGWTPGDNLRVDIVDGGGSRTALEAGAARFRREGKDLVCAVGTDAAEAAARRFRTTPVVGAGVLYFTSQPWFKGHKNLTGTMSLPEVVQQFDTARRVLNARRIAVLYSEDSGEADLQLKWLQSAAADKGITLVKEKVAHNASPEAAAASLAGRADAVYVAVDERMQRHFRTIAAALTAAGIPVVGGDEDMVRHGAVLSVSEDYYRMGFDAGLMAARLLEGALPQDLPVRRQKDPDLVVNMAAVNAFHLGLPGGLWQKARKLYLYDGQPARP